VHPERVINETVLAPGERIGVGRALRAITVDAAYMLGTECTEGSLEPRKFADFAILEQDPHQVHPTELRDIPVWGTARSGVLHQAS
jgi:predicted amidohydrolase YtcJ